MSRFSRFVVAATVFSTLIAFWPMPALGQMQVARNNALIQQARQIGQVLFAYACDNAANGNAYPTGTSSTEVFQKLIDSGYVTDPSLFYVKMPGKVAPTSNKLKPENVCFDLTIPVDKNSSDLVPLVFLTGFKIDYTPGSSALPISDGAKSMDGLPIFYKGNSAVFLKKGADGSVPNAVPKNLIDTTHHYQQLTPTGPIDLASLD